MCYYILYQTKGVYMTEEELRSLSFEEALNLTRENLVRWMELNPEKWEEAVKQMSKE